MNNANNPVVKVKGIALVLGDGATYVVPPLNLGALEQLQGRIAEFSGNPHDPGTVSTAIDVVLAAL